MLLASIVFGLHNVSSFLNIASLIVLSSVAASITRSLFGAQSSKLVWNEIFFNVLIFSSTDIRFFLTILSRLLDIFSLANSRLLGCTSTKETLNLC